MSTRLRSIILIAAVNVVQALAPTLAADAKPGAQQQNLKPVLKAIDPSQAQEAPIEEAQPAQPPVNQALEQMIPEFGKPNPTVPPSMAAPMPPGPGFAAGYAPAQPVPNDTLQAPPAPDDPRLARLEQAAFGSTYPEHDTDDRIEHLEREAFSKVFEGDTESRLQRLMAKYNPPSAFGGPPAGRIPAYQPPTSQSQYRPQPPQYQPSNYQQPPPQQTAYQPPPQQQPAYQPPPQQTAYAPPSMPAYRPPAQQGYMPPQQQQYQQPPAYQPAPPSIPSQPYRPPQQAWQQPAQQPQYSAASLPYPPGSLAPPSTVPEGMPSAPPSIPQGPVTMGSFNRQPPQQPQQPQQQPRQPQQNPYSQPGVGTVPAASTAGSSNMRAALDNMPYDTKAGDYSQQILRLGGSFARWTNLPVRVHIPMNTPENWRAPIDSAVKRWAQYLPTVIAPTSEPADIEVGWINHLMPRQLGITNLEIFNGHPRVTVYLLRPSYYPPDVPEATLHRVALHEFGHALGLFGHSSLPGDAMFSLDTPVKSGLPKTPIVSQRDINTLRRIYEAAPLPDGFQSPQPISWP